MKDKKYYTISEVSKALNFKESTLRSLDNIFKGKLTFIRGRRYYKAEDMVLLKNAILPVNGNKSITASANSIDNLMDSMLALRAELMSAL